MCGCCSGCIVIELSEGSESEMHLWIAAAAEKVHHNESNFGSGPCCAYTKPIPSTVIAMDQGLHNWLNAHIALT